ncbi:MAG: hypothetical protein MZW92_16895 [Comamonadaceae bacterium]|nr:hypothetical protein [Comamonadaceae bacterium]
MAFRAIGFDIDGTLYPSLRLSLALAGFAVRNYRCLKAFGRVRRELRELFRTPGYRASPRGHRGVPPLPGEPGGPPSWASTRRRPGRASSAFFTG